MRKRRSTRARYLGNFHLGAEGDAVGQLLLGGPATSLELHSDELIGIERHHPTVTGLAYSGEHLTLINCHRTRVASGSVPGGRQRHSATFIPDYVAVGTKHFDPEESCIRSINFSTTDLHTVFSDYHAFGIVFDSKGHLQRILDELKEDRAKEVGENPMIGYFAGRHRIVEVLTALGRVSVNHGVGHNFGGPSGVALRSRMYVAIERDAPVAFCAAMSAMQDISLFLSVAAGRSQGITQIGFELDDQEGKPGNLVRIHMSYPWRRKAIGLHRPHARDVPLRPIEDPLEFHNVLSDWVYRQAGWRFARYRYLDCLSGVNAYGADRLITAANMFDLLPRDAVPGDSALSPELAAARDDCTARFAALPASPERDTALSAMGRLGSPFLVKRVLHRVAILEPTLGSNVPDLAWVATIAVKCRNAYVHGKSKDFDIEKVEGFVPYLTDALEFIFGASDLVQAGWNSERWAQGSSVGGHSFSRFRDQHLAALSALKEVLRPGKQAAGAALTANR